MPTLAEYDAARKAANGGAAPVAETTSNDESGLAPSGESVAGSVLGGFLGPLGSTAGSAIGSSLHELQTSVPKLLKAGLIGPMSSEGVGTAMAEPAARIARDVGVNAALNHAPAAIAKGLKGAGTALTKFGESAAARAPLWQRGLAGAVADPLLKMLGIPSGAAEVASIAAPPVARAIGPIATRVGESLPSTVMEGLTSAARRLRPGVEEAPVAVDPGVQRVRDAVEGAQGDVSAGFSRPVAAKLNGLKSRATDISHPTADVVNPGELFPYQKDALAGLREAATAKPSSPIEEFYANDPQARTGGEGRMTGQFEEGPGGLSSIAADELARLGMSPLRYTELMQKFGGKQGQP